MKKFNSNSISRNNKYNGAGGGAGGGTASDIAYDNSLSGLVSENVQQAIDELHDEIEIGNIYSTDEKKVGEWIDGKPIYEKTFVVQSATGTGGIKVVDTSNLDIDIMISFSGFIRRDVSADKHQIVDINWFFDSNTYTSTFYEESENGIFQKIVGQIYQNKPLYITMKYTKTID